METSFDKWLYDKEVLYRGTFLSFCCDLEWILMDLTTVCLSGSVENFLPIKETIFGKISMGGKIDLAKISLKKYKSNYLEEFESVFTDLTNLSTYRNKFAHARIVGDQNKLDREKIIFVEIKNGEEKSTSYTLEQMEEHFEKYREHISKIESLVDRISTEKFSKINTV